MEKSVTKKKKIIKGLKHSKLRTMYSQCSCTIKYLRIGTPKLIAVITCNLVLQYRNDLKDGIVPDQQRSSLIWVCTVCSDLSVPILRILMVNSYGIYAKPWDR